jgi:hypothetical protein
VPKQYVSTTFKARYFGIIKVYCEVSIFLSLIKTSVIDFQIFGEKKRFPGIVEEKRFLFDTGVYSVCSNFFYCRSGVQW